MKGRLSVLRIVAAASVLVLLSGCGVPGSMVSVRQSAKATLEAQSKTSLAKLETGVRAYYKGVFQKLDLNHNGYMTKDESRAATLSDTGFDSVDANLDGKISFTEFVSKPLKPATLLVHNSLIQGFIKADQDGDLELVASELVEPLYLTFEEADLNKNGKVIFSELEEAVGKAFASGKDFGANNPPAPGGPVTPPAEPTNP